MSGRGVKSPVVVVLSTLDTKGAEANFLRECLEAGGSRPVLVDIGVLGEPRTMPDVSNEEVARRGGMLLADLRRDPDRQTASPVMIRGATALLAEYLERGELQAVIGLGGTQGTSNATAVMRSLPYGLPKVMVSTMASGDVSAFVDIKDITMMFSVGDLLGLNPLTRKILANAAGAACGMAAVEIDLDSSTGEKPVVGLTNLGVLTEGAERAIAALEQAGCEVLVFHAVGSGGRAMEQLIKEGVITAVFDYALGEISDELFGGLRAGTPERLTVAASMGLPQVLCPGGAEHIGLFVDPPETVPQEWEEHLHVFHNPVILAPRLDGQQLERVGAEIGARLKGVTGRTCLFLPKGGVSRYSKRGGPLADEEGDALFFEALRKHLPPAVELVEREEDAEDEAFVGAAVKKLVALIGEGARPS
ncbi:MAG: Tm-1-like ATP-binding domain-containing protein [Planctomycetota bacterium]|jgi:uncharacterized protein (UPF0261 family)|nr:Tm-1-like ATP-binding domain-containing protein [Planctomycetota bacterium]